MINLEKVDAICKEIDEGPHYGGLRPETDSLLQELGKIIGRIVFQYTDPLRGLLKKKRIHDLSAHAVEIYGYTLRIRKIARMCNQGEIERRERDADFRVEVPEPMYWPMKGDLHLTATIYIEGEFYKRIRCVVFSETIDNIEISSKSLSKRAARERRLGQWLVTYCNEFRIYIEEKWKTGDDLSKLDELTYRDLKLSN